MTPAATVVLVRAGADGAEVFLVQRHGRSGFMPNAWVFPGGRVEPEDAALPSRWWSGGAHTVARLGLPEDVGRAALIGGVRETFEESGLWLGHGAPDPSTRAPLAAGEVSLATVLEQAEASLDLDRLLPWARWVTPEGERRRFDTVFLLARVEDAGGRHDDRETVASGWFRPADVLAAGLHTMGLAPPTWWTLHELAQVGDAEAVVAAAASRDLAPVQPVLSSDAAAFGILLPGDPGHPEPRRPDLPTRITLGPDGWAATP